MVSGSSAFTTINLFFRSLVLLKRRLFSNPQAFQVDGTGIKLCDQVLPLQIVMYALNLADFLISAIVSRL